MSPIESYDRGMKATRLEATRLEATRLEAIGSAAAGIAHDINNQLTLIVNHLAVADTERAQEAVRRCSQLTAGLLSYCKGEAAAPGPVDPGSFLRKFTRELCLPEGITLVLKVPAALPAIVAEPVAAMRALSNLVSNACAAMEGAGTLWITAAPGTIEVRDSGPGIPNGCARQIFEPFFSTKGSKGTGLGLAIVRETMRQQGGMVSVQSAAGKGAAFVLRFRLA
jgi:signal transduction histidine kinase